MIGSDPKETACFGVGCFMMTLFSDYQQVEDVPRDDLAILQGMYITIGMMMIGEEMTATTFTKFSELHTLGQETIMDFMHRPGMFESVQDNIFKIPNYVPDDL